MVVFTTLLASCIKDTSTKELTSKDVQLEIRTLGCEPPYEPLRCYRGTRYYTLAHPMFPGCSFEVKVKVVKCQNPYSASFYDFSIVSHNCMDYETYI